MKDYIEDTFDDIEADIYGVLGRINALRMDVHHLSDPQPPRKEWVDLSPADFDRLHQRYGNKVANDFVFADIVCDIKTTLKEKNHVS